MGAKILSFRSQCPHGHPVNSQVNIQSLERLDEKALQLFCSQCGTAHLASEEEQQQFLVWLDTLEKTD